MKLLRIQAQGLALFKEELDICFLALQRVAEDDKETLISLFSNIYLNPTQAVIGINASGKTSILKLILFALNLLNNEPINHMETKSILHGSEEIRLTTYFYSESKEICKLETVIVPRVSKMGEHKYQIREETLWKKPASSVRKKKEIFVFDGMHPVAVRNSNEDFLLDDVSIVIAHNKKSHDFLSVVNMLSFTNMNVLPVAREIPLSVIAFLDPTIEALYFENLENKNIIHLKFRGQSEIILNDARELGNYLSSGTIKGIIAFTMAMETLKKGGYMVVDEIENHFNKEIVSTFIRFFMNTGFNKNGAVLVYTTHYPEILDEYDRNDSIFITRNRDGIQIENLSKILNRNDIKKSEAYQSGFLEGTTPTYDAYLQLKKSMEAYL